MNNSDRYILFTVLFVILIKLAGLIRTDLIIVDYYISGVTKSIALFFAVFSLTFAVKEAFIYKLILLYSYIQLACCAIYIGVYLEISWIYSISYLLFLTLIIILLIFKKDLKEFYKGWTESFNQRRM